MAREHRRQHQEVVAGHKHLVHLGVPCEPVANEALIVLGNLVVGHVKRLVQELEIVHDVADVGVYVVCRIQLPPAGLIES